MDNYDAIINAYLEKGNNEKKAFADNWEDMRTFIHDMLSIDKIRNDRRSSRYSDIHLTDEIYMDFYECSDGDNIYICGRDETGKRLWYSFLNVTYDYKYQMNIAEDNRFTFGDNLFNDKGRVSEKYQLDKPYDFVMNWNNYKPIVKEWVVKKLMEN